jgi:voltage-gated potassium channel
MLAIEQVWRFVQKYGLGWRQVAINTLGLFLVSWVLFWLTDPANPMVRPENYHYFFQVSATTVGYGDFSPKTLGSKVVSDFFLPCVLVNTASVIATITQSFVKIKERFMNGSGQHRVSGHVVIFGYHRGRTETLIRNLEGRRVVVVVPDDSDITTDPFAGTDLHAGVGFVRGDFHDPGTLVRANVGEATAVIVDLQDANAAYVLVDHLREASKAHMVVGLMDLAEQKIFRQHGTGVACVQWHSWSLMSKEAEAPGAAQILTGLMTDGDGADLYAVRLPDTFRGASYDQLLVWLNHFHGAVLMALNVDGVVNESPQGVSVRAGEVVYYKISGQPLSPDIFDHFKAPQVTF